MFLGCLVRFSSLERTSFMTTTSRDHSLYMSATSSHSVWVIACQLASFPYTTWLFLQGWVTRRLSSSSQPRTYSPWWRKTHLRGKNSLAKKPAARWRMELSLCCYWATAFWWLICGFLQWGETSGCLETPLFWKSRFGSFQLCSFRRLLSSLTN